MRYPVAILLLCAILIHSCAINKNKSSDSSNFKINTKKEKVKSNKRPFSVRFGRNKKQDTDVKMTLGDRSSSRKVKGNPLRSGSKTEHHKKQWQWQFWKGKKNVVIATNTDNSFSSSKKERHKKKTRLLFWKEKKDVVIATETGSSFSSSKKERHKKRLQWRFWKGRKDVVVPTNDTFEYKKSKNKSKKRKRRRKPQKGLFPKEMQNYQKG